MGNWVQKTWYSIEKQDPKDPKHGPVDMTHINKSTYTNPCMKHNPSIWNNFACWRISGGTRKKSRSVQKTRRRRR